MARYVLTAALLIGLSTSSGCCWWAEHWCPCHNQQPVMVQPVGYAPGCGCPTAGYTPAPVPVQTAMPNWTAPQPGAPQVHNGCTCTCP